MLAEAGLFSIIFQELVTEKLNSQTFRSSEEIISKQDAAHGGNEGSNDEANGDHQRRRVRLLGEGACPGHRGLRSES